MGNGKATRAAANHRDDVWAARKAVVERNAQFFAIAAGVSVLFLAVIGLIYARVVHSDFLAGLAVGSFGVAIAAALFWLIDAQSGAHNKRFGTYGEEGTAALFETRRMRRDGWGIVHNLGFAGLGDVDHVAVGPSGVLVIESKWANCSWTVNDDAITSFGDDPIDQVRHGADKIRRLMASEGLEITPQPVLVQWGPRGLDSDDWSDRLINGVLVVRRPRSTKWLELLPTATAPNLDPETRQAAMDVLVHFRDRALVER